MREEGVYVGCVHVNIVIESAMNMFTTHEYDYSHLQHYEYFTKPTSVRNWRQHKRDALAKETVLFNFT